MTRLIECSVFEKLFDMIPFLVFVTDIKRLEIIYGNKLFREEFGDIDNSKCYTKIFGLNERCFHCKVGELEKNIDFNNKVIYECFNELKDRWYRLEERLMYWPDGRLVKYTIAIDVSEFKKSQNELAEAHANLFLKSIELENKNRELEEMYKRMKDIAEIDYLTGLYNRRFFYEFGEKTIEQVRRYNNSCYLALIDIDNFKMINDNYGHQIGDEILQYLSSQLRNEFRKSDIIARIGGEEFALILMNTDDANALKVLNNFKDKIEKSCYFTNNMKVQYTISIGATKLEPTDLSHNLKKADNALYNSKKQGKNMVTIK